MNQENTHRDHWVSGPTRSGEPVNMHMRPESFQAESAAFILIANDFKGGLGPDAEDADEWHRRAKGIIFW